MHPPRRTEISAVKKIRRCALAPALLLGTLHAQDSVTGALHGTLPAGSKATLRNLETGLTLRLPAGPFTLPRLPPGDYLLLAAPAPPTPISIHLFQTTELTPTPEPLLTQALTQPDQDDDGLLSSAGLPSTQTASSLDGLPSTQSFTSTPQGSGASPAPDPEADSDSAELSTGPAHGLARGRRAGAAYAFSAEAVQEFRVASDLTSAATGGGAAALALVTRSGSPNLHGSATYTVRSQLFAATNSMSLATTYAAGVSSTQAVKPQDLSQTVAATVGGPVPGTRKLFFFNALDVQRRSFPAISSPANPAFYTLTAIQQALLANRGVTPAATAKSLSYLASLTGEVPRNANQIIDFARADLRPNPRQDLSLETNLLRYNRPAGLTEAPVVAAARASLGNSQGSLTSVLARVSSTFGARIVNDLRLQVSRDLQFETPQTPLPQESAIGPGGLAPEVVIGPNGLLFGTPASLSNQAFPDERRLDAADTLSLRAGRHTFQFGVEFSAVDDRVATLANQAGTFRYDSTRTTANAGGLVDFITDYTFSAQGYPSGACPSITAPVHLFCFTSFTQSFGANRTAFSTQQYAAFAEETWRPRANLTLHAGARYEYLLLPIPQQPNPTLDAVFSARGASSSFPEDRNNLGPRLGLAWSPHGLLTVRASYGTFFGRLPGATVAAALEDTAQPASTTKIRITPAVTTACPQAPGQGFGYLCTFLTTPPNVVTSNASAMVFDRHFRLPNIQQAQLELERSFGHALTVSAGYVVNIDRQLATSTDINIAPSTATARFQLAGGGRAGGGSGLIFAVPLYTARVSPLFGPVTDVTSSVNASYNALVLAARVRLRPSLTLNARYTWSKAIDTGASLTGVPRTNGQFDPLANGYDKGLSALNYPQSFRFSALYATTARNQSVRGWELAPILAVRSGRPYSYEIFGGTRLLGGHLSINGSGGALYLPTVGRDTLRLPLNVQADLRLARSFSTQVHSRQVTFRISAEAFNVTNRVNISSVEERAYLPGTPAAGITPLLFQDAATLAGEGLTTQPFGTPNAAATSLSRERQLQFSGRVFF